MNQSTMQLITAKIERALEQIRVLKSEKSDLEALVASLRESLDEKDKTIDLLREIEGQLHAEIRSLQEALNERDSKLQVAEDGLLQSIEALNKTLGIENTENDHSGLFDMREGNA
jgi:chromosome segregation ATPase